MKKIIITIGLFVSSNICFSQIKIGNQIWSDKDLDVITFRNGDSLIQVESEEEWLAAGVLKIPVCYKIKFRVIDTTWKNILFYNWYAINDYRGLAPEGYHIPSEEEWQETSKLLDNNDSLLIKKLEFKYNGFISQNDGKLYQCDLATSHWLSDRADDEYYERGKQLYTPITRDWILVLPVSLNSGFNVRCIKD